MRVTAHAPLLPYDMAHGRNFFSKFCSYNFDCSLHIMPSDSRAVIANKVFGAAIFGEVEIFHVFTKANVLITRIPYLTKK